MIAVTRPLVLVTGSTDGIGLETALQMVRRGADVVLHGRSEKRLKAAHERVQSEAGREIPRGVLGDFSSLASVRAMADELERTGVRPTVLVNNAGIFCNERSLSADGFELTMAVNHLAPFVLTHALLRQPGASVQRVVNVSSMAHQGGRVDVNDVGLKKRRFDAYGMYAASKAANVLFSNELARRKPLVMSNALHPGVVSTKLLTEGFGMQGGDTLEESAATSVMLALDEKCATVSGGYYAQKRKREPSAAVQDRELARAFYEASARAAGVEPFAG